jgi:hypothetical protein
LPSDRGEYDSDIVGDLAREGLLLSATLFCSVDLRA